MPKPPHIDFNIHLRIQIDATTDIVNPHDWFGMDVVTAIRFYVHKKMHVGLERRNRE